MENYTINEEKPQRNAIENFNRKKNANYKLTPLMSLKVSPTTLNRIDSCADNLLFLSDILKEKKRLKQGFFCGNRWCPMCAWRKARKDGTKLSIIMSYMQQRYRYEFIFLTLTTPNVKADMLESEIKKFNNSFNKMMKLKRTRGWGTDYRGNQFNGPVKGYVRKLEVTYNKDRDDYNPHFHVMIAVRKSYFTDSKNYIKQAEWLQLWRNATGMEEITQVHVQKVGGSDKNKNKEKAVLEVAKYSAKDSEYMESEIIFDTFFSTLKNKRLMVYAGVMNDIAKSYDLGELDDFKMKDNTEYVYQIISRFNYKLLKYEEEYRLMTKEEQEKINNEIAEG